MARQIPGKIRMESFRGEPEGGKNGNTSGEILGKDQGESEGPASKLKEKETKNESQQHNFKTLRGSSGTGG